MAIEDELVEHGATILGPVATVSDALKMVAEQDFDAAVMNVHLRDGYSNPVADELMARNKPFVFVTSYERRFLPGAYASIPLISKPLRQAEIVERLLEILETKLSPANQ